jgi:integrase
MDLAYLTGQRPADVLKMRLPDIRDGYLWLTQSKTRKKLRMAIAGELAALIERIRGRTYKVTSLALIRNEMGQPFSYHALWNRFEEARKRAASALDIAGNSEAAIAVRGFQFRRFYMDTARFAKLILM